MGAATRAHPSFSMTTPLGTFSRDAAHFSHVRVCPFIFQVDRIIFCLFLPVDIAIYEELMQYYFPGDLNTATEEVKDESTEEKKNEEENKKEKEESKEEETAMDMDKSRDEQSMDLDTTKEEIKVEDETKSKEDKSEEEVKG